MDEFSRKQGMKYTVPPRKYTDDEIDAVWASIVDMSSKTDKPTFIRIVLRTWKLRPTFHGKLSKDDVWFICRDHLRNELGWIDWNRYNPLEMFTNTAFRITRLGMVGVTGHMHPSFKIRQRKEELAEYESLVGQKGSEH